MLHMLGGKLDTPHHSSDTNVDYEVAVVILVVQDAACIVPHVMMSFITASEPAGQWLICGTPCSMIPAFKQTTSREP